MKYLILFLLLFQTVYSQPENPGAQKAGWTSITLNRNGRNLNCRIYYPAFSEGSEAQIDTTKGYYPVIGFGHGFFMQTGYYLSLFSHLATHGYVVIAPQFPDTQHDELARDLLFCVNYIKSQNNVPLSRYYGLIDTSVTGLSGHSMGGGASLLTASRDTSVKVVAPLAAAETNPSTIAVMSLIKGVVYLISGQNDGITPVNSTQSVMFSNALPIKALPIIKGGNHTKFMDVSTWDWTDPNGYLTRNEQLRLTRRYLTSVFNLFLKKDTAFFNYSFGSTIKTDTSIIFSSQLKSLTPKSFNLIFPKDTLIYPPHILIWESTYSLNLLDTVKYSAIVSTDSLMRDTFKIQEGLLDTTALFSLGYGKFYWKVKAYTSDSNYTFSNQMYCFNASEPLVINDGDKIKLNFELYQNYPNPFNPSTRIQYQVSSNSHGIL